MMRRSIAALVGLVVLGSIAQAQVPVRLRWAAGQVLQYRVEHSTDATDVQAEQKSNTRSLVRVTKRWQVVGVDPTGVATLQLSLGSMLQERTTSSGDVLRYDSANPDKSTPQLKEALEKYLNTTLATLRVDGSGKVVHVQNSKSDPSAYENELPFLVALPGAVKVNDAWERNYKITLAPPLGTGEKYDAVQQYRCTGITGDLATISLTTQLKDPPKDPADAVPLWQMLPQGEVVFDVKNGRLHKAVLKINKEIKNHQGENTSCTFNSTLSVEYAGDR